jgi:hypothetical protein
MSAASRLALYRQCRASLLWDIKAYRRCNAGGRVRSIQVEMADARALMAGSVCVSGFTGGYLSGDDRCAISAAKRHVAETGERVTVWHDCGADEPYTLPGIMPDPSRACQRVATVSVW